MVEITEVRVKLVSQGRDKLRAFCSITIDDSFVIRDLKIIEGAKGVFVAMPSRRLMSRCPGCKTKNHQGASYCNHCGRRLPPPRGAESRGARSGAAAEGNGGRVKMHADIAHPIHSECRSRIQEKVLAEYAEELQRARVPGYSPQDLDDFERDSLDEPDWHETAGEESSSEARWAERPLDGTRADQFRNPHPPRVREEPAGPYRDRGSVNPAVQTGSPSRLEPLLPRPAAASPAQRGRPAAARKPPRPHDDDVEDNFGAGLFT